MAITLTITDGTDTVNFNDGSNLYLGSAFQMNVGEGPTTEIIIAGWGASLTADSKAVITKRFNRLIRKGIAHYRENRIDRAVWLVWKPDNQTDTQYAKVMGGGEVEIVTHTIGAMGGGVFAPLVIREGGWRSIAPDGTAGELAATKTIYNKWDGDGTNYANVASSRTNDAPALLHITVAAGAMAVIPDIMLIGVKRDINSTELDKFRPHHNPAALVSNGGGSQVDNNDSPADFQLELTASGTPYWEITDTDLDSYIGHYHIYANTYIGAGTGTWRVRFKTDFFTGEWAALSSTATQNLIYLGDFSLPGTDVNPFVTRAATADTKMYLEFGELTGTATAWLRGLILVPADVPPLQVEFDLASGDKIVVDGINELSYALNSDNAQKLTGAVIVKGRYHTSIGGTENRFFFFWWGDPVGGYSRYVPNNNATMTILAVDRFLGLRGNT